MNSEVVHGQILAGKYRVEELLGRGGMGVVMAAIHLQLGQKVALKFLTKEACLLPEAVARFLREARAAVQIQSEHVARVLDVGTLDTGAPYIVMEYLRGLDLKELGRARGPLPPEEAVDYLIQSLDAVAEAHALGIVHRDLKPSNLFVTHRPDGSPLVKVLDFGISKAIQADAAGQMHITATAAIMGSPQYMSPEQIRSSKNVDARSDIWALGTILHELLAGTPAYTADTVPGLLATIVADPPQSLASVCPNLPPGLEAVVLRCLEKDRERRYSSVGELSRALLPFAPSDSRQLVTRICRVLGESERSIPAPIPDLPPRSKTVVQPRPGSSRPVPATHVSQTNGSFALTGNERSAWYQKGGVQVGMGLSAVALGVIGWLTLSAPPSDAPQSSQALSAPGAAAAQTAGDHASAPAAAPAALPAPVDTTPAIRLAPAAASAAAASAPAPSAAPASAATPGGSAEKAPESKRVEPAAAAKPKGDKPARPPAKPPVAAKPPEPAAARPPEPAPRPAATTKPKKNDSYDDLFGDTK
jgi:serine/threonine protein kinase